MIRCLRLLAAGSVLFLAACASRPPLLPSQAPTLDAPIELEATPFHPQRDYQCGPAALATVLNVSGVPSQPDDLVDQVYVPAKKGALQVEMLAATRRAGRIPYRVDPSLAALLAEIEGGRPVLVMQNLGLQALPVWHYAVVIGVDPGTDSLILRSGTERRRVVTAHDFLRSWRLAGHWGVVVLRPGELPADPIPPRLLEATALAEPLLSVRDRLHAYRVLVERWPSDTTARFGYALALHADGQLDRSLAMYRTIIADRPRHAAALNNLAEVLADQGCTAQAVTTASRALQVAHEDQPALIDPITATLHRLQGLPAGGAACAARSER
ncbi:MAG: PA2778 family cysteine peptidase [Gammaproteobacteria bacterium]|nr:PA2778 family cysteine peptidase [Gammaproteobacteria bacterium]